jgi:hypothetical protein
LVTEDAFGEPYCGGERRPNIKKGATGYRRMLEKAPNILKLTTKSMVWFTQTMVVRGEHTGQKSGDGRSKGTIEFTLFCPSPLDSIYIHGPGSMAELRDFPMGAGVASIDGSKMNSSELLR